MTQRQDYIPFGKPSFTSEEISAVTRVMESGWVGMGPETIKFEEELAAYFEVPHVVSVNSCTSALFLSLLASDIGKGDEVIVPSLTWYSTANAVIHAGAEPVFCDVDRASMCVTAGNLMEKLTKSTRAVIIVHYGGQAADIEEIRRVLPENVLIIEDAAHALGAKFSGGNPVGASGNLTCFSFYANKNLSTSDGGAVSLTDGKMANRLKSLRMFGLDIDAWQRFTNPHSLLYTHVHEIGYKMGYTDLQACIGRIQLRRQAQMGRQRQAIADRYYEVLSREFKQIEFQSNILHAHHSKHLFVIKLPVEKLSITRDDFVIALRRRNIGAAIHYEPLHKAPLYAKYNNGILANTDFLFERIVTLPISASMSIADADYVIENIAEILKEQSL